MWSDFPIDVPVKVERYLIFIQFPLYNLSSFYKYSIDRLCKTNTCCVYAFRLLSRIYGKTIYQI